MASDSNQSQDSRKVGIIGSGLIGRSWAMLFASAGYKVVLFDSDPKQLSSALADILEGLNGLEKKKLLRGKFDAETTYDLISCAESLTECVSDAKYIQECIPESLELKKKLFLELDTLVGDTTILASSTSCIPASEFSAEMTRRSQVIVVHPTNPPFYCPLTEVVPAPYTSQLVKDATIAILKEIGQSPILLKKELPGFALNRIQYALISECFRLIEDDAISVADMDKVMTEGLGMRYAFMGPLQTCHLNAEGMANYCERYGDTIYNVASTFGPTPVFGGPVAERIAAELTERIPLDQLAERRRWRDVRLAELAKLKLNLGD